ncbi:hypothetical protein NEOLEDRAFT_1240017 [Neolentinus lepideus HHB14362 ss-1]|uniref:Uncharacterized protein n=1 Tax=Neolentinus lepideus HHB14362 ss-1 TaxID=1314782 RepID=A0A165UAM0_9AGAM|nr:hypothetical protein NEOLEDRAFT_1240017 [Neolentinus lepideus HHB14362 ss-1]
MSFPILDYVPPRLHGLDQVLPSELWLEVIDTYRTSGDASRAESQITLSCISRVCRYLCEISRPLLFSDMRFSGVLEDDFPHDYHLSWCANVRAHKDEPDSLASCVRSYTLSNWSARQELLVDEDPPAPNVLWQHIQILPLLSGLQDLCLTDLILQVADVEIVLALTGLRSLRFIGCKWSHLTRPLEVSSTMTHLKKFEYTRTWSTMGDFFEEYMPKVLEMVATPALRSWKTDHPDLARNLLLSDSLLLEELRIPVQKEDLSLLSMFLSRTPTIVDFKMDGLGRIAQEDLDGFRLHPAELPNLRALQCPLRMLSLFLPGRPIRLVRISDFRSRVVPRGTRHININTEPFLALKQWASVIEELTVPMSIYDNVALEDYFPTLKSLRIRDDHGLPFLIKSHNPKVQELRCDCYQEDPDEDEPLGRMGVDLPKQRKLLLRLHAAFPDATRVTVTWSPIQWRRSNVSSTDWTPVVVDRDSLRKRLLFTVQHAGMNPHEIVDEDGCLEKVFLPHEMTPALRELLHPVQRSPEQEVVE